MAQIIKRTTRSGEVRYDVRTRLNGRVVTRTFRRKRDADAYATTVEADRLRGIAIDPRGGRVLFTDYSRAWLVRRPDLAASTRHDYRLLLDTHLIPTFGDTPLGHISPSAVRAWWAVLVSRHPARAAKAYRLMRAILNTAVLDELLVRNPCQVSGAGQEHSPERPTASVAEVEALAQAMPRRLGLVVLLAAFCGLRRGELLALCRQDVDLLHGLVHVERARVHLSDGTVVVKAPKTAAGRRRVSVPPALLPTIEAHLEEFTTSDPEVHLFTGTKGAPLSPRRLAAAWNEARRSVGRTDLHLHDLRHTGNTWAAATGANTAELMARMGHASPTAALRYQHATEERDRVIAEALSALIKPAPIIPIDRRPRDGRAMDSSSPADLKTLATPLPGEIPEQPQRDSNPCRHLERVPEQHEQRTLWDGNGQ
jgi:integrase